MNKKEKFAVSFTAAAVAVSAVIVASPQEAAKLANNVFAAYGNYTESFKSPSEQVTDIAINAFHHNGVDTTQLETDYFKPASLTGFFIAANHGDLQIIGVKDCKPVSADNRAFGQTSSSYACALELWRKGPAVTINIPNLTPIPKA